MVATLLTDSLVFDHTVVNLIGILLSVYALYVEVMKHRNPKYVALCDINEHMCCSKVLTSEYSKGFGLIQYLVGKEHFLNVPNCVTGIVFYSILMILGFVHTSWAYSILLGACLLGCLGSIYLAFVLFYVLKDICVVCIATYVVNFSLLYLNYHRFYAY